MSELISGKEAKLAWAEGVDVQWRQSFDWSDLGFMNILGIFDDEDIEFRLKPRTITINGIEVPAPFEPKEDEVILVLNDMYSDGYMRSKHKDNFGYAFGVWRTEEEIKQVVAALRSVFCQK